ncbi:NAD-dependent epimerase/dehydratase family protein [Chitinibacter sp. SCUT-21]|uniref:NAD-dependent epimerase/dehydratase family protein n=1 Tax=Chitinibacter sp. SCUT-21 TaxID=2970891 RepID=UPI0035A6877E
MRKKRLLIIGCGDVLQRALPWLTQRFKVYATARNADKARQLHTLGVTPILADLDQHPILQRIAALADYLIHSAPPEQGHGDQRTRRLLAALSTRNAHSAPARRHKKPILAQRRLVYISTSGVYGDHSGAWINETSSQKARNARALRRVDAEQQLRAWAKRQSFLNQHPTQICIARAPGIYALDRLPTARIARGEVGIVASEDSVSNHIHAADLAHAVCLALFRGKAQRTYNIVDDVPGTMSEWFDQVADFTRLARVPKVSREQAQTLLSPTMLSYMNESRRIKNQRAKRELRWSLKYPDTATFFAQHQGQYIATTKY